MEHDESSQTGASCASDSIWLLWLKGQLLKGSEVKEQPMSGLKSLLNVVDKRNQNDIFQYI